MNHHTASGWRECANGRGIFLSHGDHHDALVGRVQMEHIRPVKQPIALLMDRAYEGDETCRQAQRRISARGFTQVQPAFALAI